MTNSFKNGGDILAKAQELIDGDRQESHDLANEAIRWKRAALDAKEAHDALQAQLDAIRALIRLPSEMSVPGGGWLMVSGRDIERILEGEQ